MRIRVALDTASRLTVSGVTPILTIQYSFIAKQFGGLQWRSSKIWRESTRWRWHRSPRCGRCRQLAIRREARDDAFRHNNGRVDRLDTSPDWPSNQRGRLRFQHPSPCDPSLEYECHLDSTMTLYDLYCCESNADSHSAVWCEVASLFPLARHSRSVRRAYGRQSCNGTAKAHGVSTPGVLCGAQQSSQCSKVRRRPTRWCGPARQLLGGGSRWR